MNREEEQFMQEQEQRNISLKNQLEDSNNAIYQQAKSLEDRDQNIAQEQLDLTAELDRINHLLRGEVLQENESGVLKWITPKDKEMIILSEYGVHLILSTIQWYLNKNTLLSNYKDEMINAKMEDFAGELTDTIFMEYEKIFQYPTFEECKKILEGRIEQKVKLRKFALELMNKSVDEEEIKKKFLLELENTIEKEIEKIKTQSIKNKLKRFGLIIREVQDAVHSTYLRAWNGQERKTLREHVTITENTGMGFNQQPRRTLDPSTWRRS